MREYVYQTYVSEFVLLFVITYSELFSMYEHSKVELFLPRAANRKYRATVASLTTLNAAVTFQHFVFFGFLYFLISVNFNQDAFFGIVEVAF